MIFSPKNAGDPPSLLVEDGKTFTIDAGLKSMSTSNVRPRNVAALLALWGFSSPQPPLCLSDHAAFEIVDSTDGFVRLTQAENGPRIGGYSAQFVCAVPEGTGSTGSYAKVSAVFAGNT